MVVAAITVSLIFLLHESFLQATTPPCYTVGNTRSTPQLAHKDFFASLLQQTCALAAVRCCADVPRLEWMVLESADVVYIFELECYTTLTNMIVGGGEGHQVIYSA